MDKIIYRGLLVLLIVIFTPPVLKSQFSIQLNCQDESSAFVGLDRKDWTSDMSAISESYQLNFNIPEVPDLTCAFLDRIEVSINGFSSTNNIMPGCYLSLWTHALNCADNSPISCGDILFDQSGLQSFFTITDAMDLSNQTIGIDIVVVVDLNNPACMQETISVGDYDASFEICLELFYEPDQIEEEIDLGEDIEICEGEMIELMGPDDFLFYEWQGPVDSDEQNIQEALPGIYTLTVTDDNGCQSFDDIEIIATPFPDIIFNQNNPYSTCEANIEDVIVTLDGISDLSDYDFDWFDADGNDVSGNDVFTPQGPGSYTLSVEDTNLECTVEAALDIIIISPSPALIQIDSVACLADSVVLTAQIPETDSLGYIYQWIFGTDTTYNSSTTAYIDGEYILNLVDSTMCLMSSDTSQIQINSINTAGQDASTSTCLNEMVDLFTLISADAFPSGNFIQVDNNQTVMNGLFPGANQAGMVSFWYIVPNAIPCPPDTALISVNVLDSTADAGMDASTDLCSDDEVDLNSLINGDPGGFIIDGSGQMVASTIIDASDLNTGNNLFQYIIDGSNCGSDTSDILINLLQAINITDITGPFCESEIIMVGNSVYDIDNPSGQDVLQSSSGCDSTVSVDMQFFAPAVNEIFETFCQDSVITVGGMQFSMSNPTGSIVLSNASANQCDSIIEIDLQFVNTIDTIIQLDLCDNETITINNQVYDNSNPVDTLIIPNGSSLGCDSTIYVDLTFAQSIDEDIIMTLCEGESIIVNGEVYDQDNPSGMENLTSINGCDSIINVDLSFDLSSQMNLNMMICDDESVQVGNDVYDQSNLSGSTVLSNANQFGCDSIVMVSLTHSLSSFVSEFEEACLGDSLFLGGSWIFSDGVYVDSLLNANGCDSIIRTTATFVDCSVATDINIQDLVCFDDGSGIISITIINYNNYPMELALLDNSGISLGTITANGPGPYTFENLEAGQYTLQGSNNSDLLFEESLSVQNANPINISSSETNPNCFDSADGTIDVMSQGGNSPLNISWDTGQSSFQLSNLSAGDYNYTVTDASGCSVMGTAQVIAPEAISFSLDISDASCPEISDGIVDIQNISGSTGNLSYSIDGQGFQSSPAFDNLAEGNYTYTIQDENNCLYEMPFSIVSNNMNDLQADDFVLIELGDSITLNPIINFNASMVSWTPSNGLSCADCLNPVISPAVNTTYTLIIEDEVGCLLEHTLLVDVNIPDITHVYFPNIFDPSSLDNSTFVPFVNPTLNIEPVSFRVFDRWGNLMHEETGTPQGWRGFVGSTQAEVGVYVYTFEYMLNGELFQVIDDLLLIN